MVNFVKHTEKKERTLKENKSRQKAALDELTSPLPFSHKRVVLNWIKLLIIYFPNLYSIENTFKMYITWSILQIINEM